MPEIRAEIWAKLMLDDEQLFEALRSAIASAEPLPDDMLRAARMCLTWQCVDADSAPPTRRIAPRHDVGKTTERDSTLTARRNQAG